MFKISANFHYVCGFTLWDRWPYLINIHAPCVVMCSPWHALPVRKYSARVLARGFSWILVFQLIFFLSTSWWLPDVTSVPTFCCTGNSSSSWNISILLTQKIILKWLLNGRKHGWCPILFEHRRITGHSRCVTHAGYLWISLVQHFSTLAWSHDLWGFAGKAFVKVGTGCVVKFLGKRTW